MHIRTILQPLRDFFFPPVCQSCSLSLSDDEHSVCLACRSSIRSVHENDFTMQVMERRFRDEKIVGRFFSLYYFQHGGVLQTMLHQLKYNDGTVFGFQLGALLGTHLSQQIQNIGHSILIPVPLHLLKERERGYNQSTIICKGIASVIGAEIAPHLVERKKYTISQTTLNAEERKTNVADAFLVSEPAAFKLKGKTCIVVDDVVTTGSTISAVAKVLQECGVERIFVASIGVAELDEKEH